MMFYMLIVSFNDLSRSCACQDPHLFLAHGGRTDFRGKDQTIYNFISSKDLSLNVITENATFKLDKLTVRGTFLTSAHVVMRTEQSRFFNVSFWGNELNQWGWGWNMVNGSCAMSGNRVHFRAWMKQQKICDELAISVDSSTVTFESKEWLISIIGNPVYGRIDGPRHRLDISITQKVPDHLFAVAPHGIIGQSYDGDGVPRKGKLDIYPPRNVVANFTTSAMADGAIDGSANDYEMKSIFDTTFEFGRFGSKRDNPLPEMKSSLRTSSSTEYEDNEEFEWRSRMRRLQTCNCRPGQTAAYPPTPSPPTPPPPTPPPPSPPPTPPPPTPPPPTLPNKRQSPPIVPPTPPPPTPPPPTPPPPGRSVSDSPNNRFFDFRAATLVDTTITFTSASSTTETATAEGDGSITLSPSNGLGTDTESHVRLQSWSFHSSFSIEVALSMSGDSYQSIFTACENVGDAAVADYSNVITLEKMTNVHELPDAYRMRFAIYGPAIYDSATGLYSTPDNVLDIVSQGNVEGFGQDTAGYFILTFSTEEGVKCYSDGGGGGIQEIPIEARVTSNNGTGVGVDIDTSTVRQSHFIGRTYFDDVGIDSCKFFNYYDTALSASQVQSLHASYATPPPTPPPPTTP